MSKKIKSIFSSIVHLPISFSVLEIFILFVGVLVGLLLYNRADEITTAEENARTFERQTNTFLTVVTIADIRFSELLAGDSSIEINKDIYAQLDIADALCSTIDTGGQNGQFLPTPNMGQSADSRITSLCSQLQNFRSLTQQRWQDYRISAPDTQKSAYDFAYRQIVESIQRFAGITDPRMQESLARTRQTNLIMSASLSAIFLVIAVLFYFYRRSSNEKTTKLQTEVDRSTLLNTELDSERYLLSTLIDNIPAAVFAKDTENNFLIANAAAARVLGVENKGSVLGHTEADFQPHDVAQRIMDDDDHVLTTGEKIFNQQETLIDINTGKIQWRQTTKAPLRDNKGQITGLVGISWDITREKEDAEALKQANDNLTLGIASLERSARTTEHLSEMVDLLQACPNMDEAFVVISNYLGKFFPGDSGMLYLLNDARNLLDRVAFWGPPTDDPDLFKPDDCWGMRRGKLHIIDINAPQTSSNQIDSLLICPHILPDGPAAYLCVPLVAHGEAIGLLHLRHHFPPAETVKYIDGWYDHEKRQQVRSIVGSLSLALANLILLSSLREQSIRDPLTGMYNRRYMEETLEREILRASRRKEPLGVIMLDIDHFKKFNDTYGHQAGDTVLQTLGQFLTTSIRGEDIACRYGGEEFILLLPGAGLEDTRKRAEELREKVHYLDVTFQGELLKTVTFSLGVSVFPQHGNAGEQLIQNADLALYRAKAEGRDRVAVA